MCRTASDMESFGWSANGLFVSARPRVGSSAVHAMRHHDASHFDRVTAGPRRTQSEGTAAPNLDHAVYAAPGSPTVPAAPQPA